MGPFLSENIDYAILVILLFTVIPIAFEAIKRRRHHHAEREAARNGWPCPTSPRSRRRLMGWRHTRSERLWLDAPSTADLDEFYAIHGDAGRGRTSRAGRHASRAASAAKLDAMIAQWAADGLGYWAVRETATGPVVGLAGCAVPPGLSWWNLYYRFAVSAQGHGYAAEVARRAIEAAHDVAPESPGAGLPPRVQHGVAPYDRAARAAAGVARPGPGQPGPGGVRVVYADRDPDEELMRTHRRVLRRPALRDGS